MPEKYTIEPNRYLHSAVTGYYHQEYVGYGKPDNPNFLNTLKNTYNSISYAELNRAKWKVTDILLRDIPEIMKNNRIHFCTCVCIPRAKALESYTEKQLYFRDAVSEAARKLKGKGVEDGTSLIKRHSNTFTTHFSRTETPSRVANVDGKIIKVDGNDGKKPYPGITEDTCLINKEQIYGKNIILIDDNYTNGVNIDEDGIQAVLNAGANHVIFYAIAYTRR